MMLYSYLPHQLLSGPRERKHYASPHRPIVHRFPCMNKGFRMEQIFQREHAEDQEGSVNLINTSFMAYIYVNSLLTCVIR